MVRNKKNLTIIFGCMVLFPMATVIADQPEYMQGWDTTEPTANKVPATKKADRQANEEIQTETFGQQIVADFEDEVDETGALIEGFSTLFAFHTEPGAIQPVVAWKELDLSQIGLTYTALNNKDFLMYEVDSEKPISKKTISGSLPWQFIPSDQNRQKGFLLWLVPPLAQSPTVRYFCFEKAGAALPPANLNWQSDLKTQKTNAVLTVSNRYYKLEFDVHRNGVLTSLVFSNEGQKIPIQSEDQVDDYQKRVPDTQHPIAMRKGIVSSEKQVLGFLLETPGRMVSSKFNDLYFSYLYLFVAECPVVFIRTSIPEQKTQTFINTIELQAYRVSANQFQSIKLPYEEPILKYLSDAYGLLIRNDLCLGIFSPRLGRPVTEKNTIRFSAVLLKGRSDGRAQPWSGEAVDVDSLLYLGPQHDALFWLEKLGIPTTSFAMAMMEDKPEVGNLKKNITDISVSNKTQDKAVLCLAEMLLRYAEADWQQNGDKRRYLHYLKATSDFLSDKSQQQSPVVLKSDNFVALANNSAGFLFEIGQGNVSLSAVYNPTLQKFVVLHTDRQRIGLWRLRLVDLSDQKRTCFEWDGRDSAVNVLPVERQESEKIKLAFEWTSRDSSTNLPTVKTNFIFEKDTPFINAWIQTGECSGKIVFWEVDFPIINGIGFPNANRWQSHLATPFHSGLRIDSPGTRLFDRDGMLYPGAAGWQFLSYYDQAECAFYFAAHDDQGYMKRFRHDPKGKSLTLRYTHQPEGKGTSATAFKQPYPCLFGPYKGDWYQATQHYRKFLLKTPWFPKKTLAENDRLPEWFKEYPACIRIFTGNENQKISDFAQKNLDLIDLLKIPTCLVQWYGWNDAKPHMVGRPEQYPDPQFLEVLPKFKEKNAYVMPYSCALLWDTRNEAFKKLGGERAAMRDLEGNIVMARYGGQPLAMVSPSHPIYQNYMVETFQKILGSLDVQALYFDMWGTSSGGHYRAQGEPWGGNGRTLGMRELGKKVKEIGLAKNPQFVIAMEGNADCYLDIVDSYILFTANLPIRMALYGDYVRPFGDKSSNWRKDSYELFEPASQFAWGVPIGRLFEFNFYKGDQLHSAMLAYYKKLIAYRCVAIPWLNYGKMLQPLKLYTGPDKTEYLREESVPHGIWRAPDGSVAFVFANSHLDKEIVFSYQANLSEYGIPADGSWSFCRLEPKERPEGYVSNLEHISKVSSAILSRTEHLAGSDVLVLVAKPKENVLLKN